MINYDSPGKHRNTSLYKVSMKFFLSFLPVSETISSGNYVCKRSYLSARNWLEFGFINDHVSRTKIELFVIYSNKWYNFEVFDSGLIAINDLSYDERCIQKVLNKASRDNLRKSMMFSCRGVTNAWRFFLPMSVNESRLSKQLPIISQPFLCNTNSLYCVSKCF